MISIKDGLKLFGIAIVCACATFVCTFFLNFYLDASAIRPSVPAAAMPLYEAQLLTAQLTCIISGCCLLLVSVVLLVFYVKLYIESHAKQLGILKAMGYSSGRISASFWVFGLSVLAGTLLGYGLGHAIMPLIYTQMGGEGLPEIPITFHAELLFGLGVLPSLFFAALAVLYAYLKLKRPALDLLRGREERAAARRKSGEKERPFLRELLFETLRSHKSLAFFVAFGGFCFSTMLQMGLSMFDLSSETMAAIIFGIGVVLAGTSLLLALTSLTNANAKTVALMRAYGYSLGTCGEAVLGGYRIPAYIGFALGTAYQFGLLKIMMSVVFSSVDYAPEYTFNVGGFFSVLAAFVVVYELFTLWFTRKLGRLSVRSFTLE